MFYIVYSEACPEFFGINNEGEGTDIFSSGAESLPLECFLPHATGAIEQKGMTFDHNFCYSFSFLLPSFFMREEKRGRD